MPDGLRDDPIDEIERQRAMHELGMAGFSIYKGARELGATRTEACRVLAAWFFSLTLGDAGRSDD